jgi:ABC-2 type transport system permease protein
MILNDIHSIWLREMKRFLRARSRLVSSLALPFVWLIFIGVGFGSSINIGGMDYIKFLAPGIIGMIILFTSIFSGISVIWDRQFGFLKEILVAPISRSSIIIGKTLGGATVAVINAMIMFLIAIGIGAISPSYGIFTAVVFMVLTSFCFVSVGLIIASNMKSMEGFQAIMSFLIMPIFFLSGALFPLNNTPAWMQAVANFNPLKYGVDGIRESLIGAGSLSLYTDLAALLAFATVLILIGAYMFRKSTI